MSETKIPTGPPPYHLSQLNQAEKNLKMQKLEFFTKINNIDNFLNSFQFQLPEKTSPEYNNTLIRKYNEIIDLLHNKIIRARFWFPDKDEIGEKELTDLEMNKVPLLTNKGGKKRRRRKTKRKRKKSKRKSRKKRKTRRRKK